MRLRVVGPARRSRMRAVTFYYYPVHFSLMYIQVHNTRAKLITALHRGP